MREKEQSGGEGPIRTLVADDDAQMLRLICSLLEAEGNIQVMGTAGDGQQALRQAEALKPNLVVLDMMMPEMNGLEACAQLRRLFPSIRIIIISGHDSAETRRLCQESGANAFVPKHRLAPELLPEIRRLFP